MSLAQTKIDETVSLLKATADKGTGKDKRRAPRRDIRAVTSVNITRELKAELRDLSARGASLVVNERLEDGSQFTLHLPAKPGSTRCPAICQVIHCRPQSDGTFLIGAEFIGTTEDRRISEADATRNTDRIRQSILA
jgi:hypothetical protein